MEKPRFIFLGSENDEPTKSSDPHPNNRQPLLSEEIQKEDIVQREFLGKDARETGGVYKDMVYGYRPNAEALEKEIENQIDDVIASDPKHWSGEVDRLLLGGFEDTTSSVIAGIRDAVFKKYYSDVSDPYSTDLIQSFTNKRISDRLQKALEQENL